MSANLLNITSSYAENQTGFNRAFYPCSLPGKMEFCDIPCIVPTTPAQELSANQSHPKKSIETTSAEKERRREKRSIPAGIKRNRQLRRNARERERQSRLNNAFDVLRGVIPDYLTGKGPERKLTQIETLRLAQHYIMALTELLQEPQQCYWLTDWHELGKKSQHERSDETCRVSYTGLRRWLSQITAEINMSPACRPPYWMTHWSQRTNKLY